MRSRPILARNAVVNRTRDATLYTAPRWCVTPSAQARGLMWTRPGPNDCLIFPFLPARVVRMHMWFVFGPIDIIALDGEGLVVAMRERFSPWSFWSSKIPVSCVLEVPVGTISRTGTRIGDRIILPSFSVTISK